MLRRGRLLRAQKHNRYTDGSGRVLDGATIPTDLYIEPMNDPEKKNAYPARPGNWLPMVAGKPNPYRGSVVVAGAGVIGSAAASLFALRGWHVTVIEQGLPTVSADGTLAGSNLGGQSFEVALMTKRGMDVLHAMGLRHKDILAAGTKVTGVLDHPTNLASLLTTGLAELHNFAVNNVAVDMHALRQRMHQQILRIPHKNGKIFFEHKLVAHLPEQKIAVVKPLALDRSPDPENVNTYEKGVTVGGVKFEEFVEGVHYDLLIGCDGAGSALRRMMSLDDESLASEKDFFTAWFVVEDSPLDPTLVHRWLHKQSARDSPVEVVGRSEMPCVFAYPKGDAGHFAVQAFVPRKVAEYFFSPTRVELVEVVEEEAAAASGSGDATKKTKNKERRVLRTSEELTALADEFVRLWCPHLQGRAMAGAASPAPKPTPGVYLPHLYNHHNPFPNTILCGDAAHGCHPFLMQGLAAGLEDVGVAVNILDSRGRNKTPYENVRQYSAERGTSTDRLRNVTERSLYYARAKHYNPVLRFRNFYAQAAHAFAPRGFQERYNASPNYRWSRSVEQMMNGRGYTSYDLVDSAQTRMNRFFKMSRIYT